MITINGKRATPNEAAKVALLEALITIEAGDGLDPFELDYGIPGPVFHAVDAPAAMTEREKARVNEQWGKKISALIKRLNVDRLPIPGRLPED